MNTKILNTLDKAANKLRGKIEGQDYFKVLLSIIFIKFLSTMTEIEWNKFKAEDDNFDNFLNIKGNYDSSVYVFDKEYLWSEIRSSTDDDLKNRLDGIFSSLGKYQPECNNISIYSFQGSDVSVQTLRQIIELIEQEVKFDEGNYIDMFGNIYEYFIAKYSTDAGRGGEFYTPHSIVNLMVAITESRISKTSKQVKIYDPTMGSAGMLVQSLNHLTKRGLSKDKLLFFGQEMKKSTWSIAKMNFILRSVQWDFGEKNDDTFSNDLFKGEKYNVILSNPPFNADFNESDYGDLITDERFKDSGIVFGKGRANYNFFNHIIYHLDAKGIAAVIMQSAAGKSPKEKFIREYYLKNNLIESIISLPQNVFSNTSIASNIWIFNKNKKNDEILFLDLQKETEKINKLESFSDEKISSIAKLFSQFIKNEKMDKLLNFKSVANSDIIEKFNSDLSVSQHVIVENSLEKIDPSELKNDFKEILKENEEISKKIKKAIDLIN